MRFGQPGRAWGDQVDPLYPAYDFPFTYARQRDPLTGREGEWLVTAARGRPNAEIADDLHISLSTVKTHLASLMSKLGARNRVELAMWAYETGRVRQGPV